MYLLLDYAPLLFVVVLVVVVPVVVVEFGFLVTFLRVWPLSGRRHSISPNVFKPVCHCRWQVFHLNNNIMIIFSHCPKEMSNKHEIQFDFLNMLVQIMDCNKAAKVDKSPQNPVKVISSQIGYIFEHFHTFGCFGRSFQHIISSTHQKWLKCKKNIYFFFDTQLQNGKQQLTWDLVLFFSCVSFSP